LQISHRLSGERATAGSANLPVSVKVSPTKVFRQPLIAFQRVALFEAKASDALARAGRIRHALINSLPIFVGKFLQDLVLVADVEAHLQKVVGVNAQLVLTEGRLFKMLGLWVTKVGMTPKDFVNGHFQPLLKQLAKLDRQRPVGVQNIQIDPMKAVAVVVTSPNVACNIGKTPKELSDDFVIRLGNHLWDGKLAVALPPFQNQAQVTHCQVPCGQLNGDGNLFFGDARKVNPLAQEGFKAGKDSRNDAGQKIGEPIKPFQIGANEREIYDGNPTVLGFCDFAPTYQQPDKVSHIFVQIVPHRAPHRRSGF
jgi:hypothetical protein